MSFLPVKETLCYIYIYVCSTNIHQFVYPISLCDAQIKVSLSSVCAFQLLLFIHFFFDTLKPDVTHGEGGEEIIHQECWNARMPGCLEPSHHAAPTQQRHIKFNEIIVLKIYQCAISMLRHAKQNIIHQII